jgi:hypothetical protein
MLGDKNIDNRTRTGYKRLGAEEASELDFTVGFPVKRQSKKFSD